MNDIFMPVIVGHTDTHIQVLINGQIYLLSVEKSFELIQVLLKTASEIIKEQELRKHKKKFDRIYEMIGWYDEKNL